MSPPSRPHPAPCGTPMQPCAECEAWAKAVVAAPGVKKYDPAERVAKIMRGAQPEGGPLGDFMNRMIELAMKQTRMSREEIEAAAVAMRETREEDFGMKGRNDRPDRGVVAARGVPELHLCNIYDRAPVECDALAAVREFLDGSKTFLAMAGKPGVRKTGSACWALTQGPGTFTTARDAVRVSASQLPEEQEWWRRIRKTGLLILDDVGNQYFDQKGFGKSAIASLLDDRYAGKLKTIVITNLDWNDFKAEVGERVADRIRESGRWLPLGGESVRRDLGKAS